MRLERSYSELLALKERVPNDNRYSAVGLAIVQTPFAVEGRPTRRDMDLSYMRECMGHFSSELTTINESSIDDYISVQEASLREVILPRIGRRNGFDDMFKRAVQFARKIRHNTEPSELGKYVENTLPSVYLNAGLGDGQDLSSRQQSRAIKTEYLFFCRALANIR